MKITIDTATDSKEEIKRIAEFLLRFAEGREENKQGTAVKEGAFNMFDEKKEEKQPFRINDLIPYE